MNTYIFTNCMKIFRTRKIEKSKRWHFTLTRIFIIMINQIYIYIFNYNNSLKKKYKRILLYITYNLK